MSSTGFHFFFNYVIEVFVLHFFASFILCVKKRAKCKKEKMSSKRLKVTSKNFRAHHSC